MSHLHLILPLLLLLNGTAEAHLLKLFAYVEGASVHGSAYFAGGTNAAGLAITISDRNNQQLVSLKTDSQGGFSYTPATPGEYHIRADTGEGHRAEWLIRADEFSQAFPAGADTVGGGQEAVKPDNTLPALPAPQLAGLIERAVARQIGPLREALQRSEDRAHLSDILGGVGFIFGLAGIALWWRGRQVERGK